MKLKQRIQAFKDFTHPNEYELNEYVIQDGKKHPFALICPGGGYTVVCSHVEGATYAERLNKSGYSAFILYYHVKEKAKYPALTSVEKQVTKEYPPTFLWCGSVDKTVSPENSHMLVRELEKNQIPHEFVEYQGVEHGVGLGENLACEPWFDRAVMFWKTQIS